MDPDVAGAAGAAGDSDVCPERVLMLASRDSTRVEGRAGEVDAARDELVGALDIAGVRRAGAAGAATSGRAGLAGSGEITPSDSVTGDAGDAGEASEPSDAGEPAALASLASLVSLASLATWFCRTARYEPPAAAARHPTANPAKTSLLNSIAIELPSSP